MSNKAYTDFIRTKLNAVVGSTAIFGGGHLFNYTNGDLVFKTPNAETLQLDGKTLIPFIITAFDGERIPMKTIKIMKRTMPIVFAVQYKHRVAIEGYIEAFADSIEGQTFTIDGVNTGLSTTITSPTGADVQLKAEDWIHLTITVFAYEGTVQKGNDMVYSLNSVVTEPLSYTASMQNETSYATPESSDFGVNRSNSKQHSRSFALFLLSADATTWVAEIEGDTLNTSYAINVQYPFGTPYNANRTMMLDRGTIVASNGTSILLELVFVDV